MAVYDVFTYSGEWRVVMLRLTELQRVVDHHVVVEATRTFSGRERSLHWPTVEPQLPPALRAKCRYVIVDTLPDYAVGTARMYETEGIQRNAGERGLYDARMDDTVMISDADEVPRADVVATLAGRQGTWRLGMLTHYYGLNLRAVDFEVMYGTRITSVREALRSGLQNLRVSDSARPVFPGGWHWSFLLPPQDAAEKLMAWSHVECLDYLPKWPGGLVGHMRSAIANRVDWDTQRNAKFRVVPLDCGDYPQWMVERADWPLIREFTYSAEPEGGL